MQWNLFVVCTERTFTSISQSRQEKVEQYAETDLLAVMLFADAWFGISLKGFRWSKKTCQLAQAAKLHRSTSNDNVMEVSPRFEFRFDQMKFIEDSNSLEAAKVRKLVFSNSKPHDEKVFTKRIEEILASQQPDGALSDHKYHAVLITGRDRLGELIDLGVSAERPEIKLALDFVLSSGGYDPIEKETGDNGMSLGIALSLHALGAIDDSVLLDATKRRIECSNKWIRTSDLCPWTPETQIRHLWAVRHLDKRAEGLISHGLQNILNAIETNTDTYNDVWGYIHVAGVVDHPIGRKIIEVLFPMLIETQSEDGGWGKQSLAVFRALHRYGYLEEQSVQSN